MANKYKSEEERFSSRYGEEIVAYRHSLPAAEDFCRGIEKFMYDESCEFFLQTVTISLEAVTGDLVINIDGYTYRPNSQNPSQEDEYRENIKLRTRRGKTGAFELVLNDKFRAYKAKYPQTFGFIEDQVLDVMAETIILVHRDFNIGLASLVFGVRKRAQSKIVKFINGDYGLRVGNFDGNDIEDLELTWNLGY